MKITLIGCRCNQVKAVEMKRPFWLILGSSKSNDKCPYKSEAEGSLTGEEVALWLQMQMWEWYSHKPPEAGKETNKRSLSPQASRDTLQVLIAPEFQTSGLKHCKRTNLCCVKSASMQHFLTVGTHPSNVAPHVYTHYSITWYAHLIHMIIHNESWCGDGLWDHVGLSLNPGSGTHQS